jgi:small nuclear ribonucleoprotein
MSDAAQRLLTENLGSLVLVKLRGGRKLRGILKSFDQHLNIVLEDADEVMDEGIKKLGTVIVRGENVVIISPAERG